MPQKSFATLLGTRIKGTKDRERERGGRESERWKRYRDRCTQKEVRLRVRLKKDSKINKDIAPKAER